MSKYAIDAADALADLAEAGEAVTFTSTLPGMYDEEADTWTGGSTATVAGYAIEDEGDPIEYKELELVQRSPATLLFGATIMGTLPPLDSVVVLAGVPKVVKRVRPIQPDGTMIVAYVIVAS